MKINLAENMLRFGVKNLKESDKQKLQQLTEQNRYQDRNYRGRLTLAQDQGGTLYGGGQPSNEWLAQQRVNTLATKFAAACKVKGIKANITTESKVVPGGYKDDALRVSRAIITGSKPTLKDIPIGNPTMTFEVRYGESYRRTNQGDIDQLYKTNLKSKKGHAQHCWQASIYITFSNDKVEVVNKNMVIPGNTFKRNYANKANLGAQDSIGGWTSFESIKQPGMTYTADNVASDQAWLYNFLLSCGRFTKQQVDDILKDLAYGAVNVGRPGPNGPVKVQRSKILEKAWGTNNPGLSANDETKGQGGTWKGNFNDFVQFYGGATQKNPKLVKYVLDQNSFKIEKVNA